MSDPLREALIQARGRTLSVRVAAAPAEPKIGDLGLGKGGCAGPPRKVSGSMQISDEIRRAATVVRGKAMIGDMLGNL